MDLERVKTESARLSPWAHLATVGRDGDPDVVPIHPAWQGDTLWFMTGAKSVKVRNIAHHPNVALHWQVTAAGDGLDTAVGHAPRLCGGRVIRMRRRARASRRSVGRHVRIRRGQARHAGRSRRRARSAH